MEFSKSLSRSAIIFPAFLSLGGSLSAATLISDNFTNSSGTNVSTVNNTEAPGVGAWGRHYTATSNMTIAPVAGFGSGNVLSINNGNSAFNRSLNQPFNVGPPSSSKLSDLNINDTLTLGFDLRLSGTFTEDGSRQLGFGFLGSADSVAYVSAGVAGSGNTTFRYRTDSRLMSTVGTELGTASTGTFAVDTNYQILFSITKATESTYTLKYLLNGATVSEQTLAVATADVDITGIGFRWSTNPGVTTHIDNVFVNLIPEPSTSLLSIGGLSAFLLLRRRSA